MDNLQHLLVAGPNTSICRLPPAYGGVRPSTVWLGTAKKFRQDCVILTASHTESATSPEPREN